MDERVRSVISEMNTIKEDVRSSFGTFSGDQLNWKPRADSWSIAQCLDHLIKSNDAFRPEFEKMAAGSRKNSFLENWSPLTGFFGGFLIRSLVNDSKKFKAPSKTIVPPSEIEADIVEKFGANVDDVNSLVEMCADADRRKTVLTSPFMPIMTYRLDDAYTALIEHCKRHVRQAKRVVGTEGFPK